MGLVLNVKAIAKYREMEKLTTKVYLNNDFDKSDLEKDQTATELNISLTLQSQRKSANQQAIETIEERIDALIETEKTLINIIELTDKREKLLGERVDTLYDDQEQESIRQEADRKIHEHRSKINSTDTEAFKDNQELLDSDIVHRNESENSYDRSKIKDKHLQKLPDKNLKKLKQEDINLKKPLEVNPDINSIPAKLSGPNSDREKQDHTKQHISNKQINKLYTERFKDKHKLLNHAGAEPDTYRQEPEISGTGNSYPNNLSGINSSRWNPPSDSRDLQKFRAQIHNSILSLYVALENLRSVNTRLKDIRQLKEQPGLLIQEQIRKSLAQNTTEHTVCNNTGERLSR